MGRHAAAFLTASAILFLASTATADRPVQRRVVIFHDGAVPRLQASGDRFVHGEFELEIRFVHTNPLCFAYSVDGRTVADERPPTPPPAWNDMVTSAEGTQKFATLDDGQAAVDARVQDLATMSTEAANQGALDQVWDACLWANPPNRVMPLQQKRIAEVDAMFRTRLGNNGAWTRILVGALDTLASVRKQLDTLPSRQGDAQQTEAARRNLRASALGLERYVTATLTLVQRLQEDLQRAQTRLASTPASTTRHVAANRKVVVEVQRSRLDRGQPHSALDAVTVSSEAYESLPPILFDVGLGPALTLRNTEDYGLGQRSSGDLPNVRRTEDGANLDLVVSMSMYIWGYRYLDDGIFDVKQLAPRPMIGLSMSQPFSSIYVGAQIDPIQFLDISFGARAYSSKRLIAPEEGELAFTNGEGEPMDPVVREGVTTQMFISLTASTDLFQRWIQRSF
jgi:hypothetical protein